MVSLTIFREGKKHQVAFQIAERPILPGDIPREQYNVLSPMNRGGK
jgi:hypothetical protein